MNQNSLSTLILSSNFCIFTFILLLEKTLSAHPKYEACVPKDCGYVQNISYPFFIKDLQEPFCGLPGFELTCSNYSGYPHSVLQTPDNDYVVQEIFYNNNSLRVSNAAVFGSDLDMSSGCLPQIGNVTLESDRFVFDSSSGLVLFSNCTLPLPTELSRYEIRCEAENRGDWDLAMFGDDRNLSLAVEKCGAAVVTPVELYGGDEKNGVGNYVELLRRGFLVNWTAADCSVCKKSGGRCGIDLDINHFRCYCPDRPHVVRCTPTPSRNLFCSVTSSSNSWTCGFTFPTTRTREGPVLSSSSTTRV